MNFFSQVKLKTTYVFHLLSNFFKIKMYNLVLTEDKLTNFTYMFIF